MYSAHFWGEAARKRQGIHTDIIVEMLLVSSVYVLRRE